MSASTRPLTLRVDRVEAPGPEWDEFVSRAEGSTFCHAAAWHGIVSDVQRQECRYLEARGDDGALLGVLPLVRMRSRVFGDHLVSMPYLSDGGPLGAAPARDRLVDAALRMAAEGSGSRLDLRVRSALPPPMRPGRAKVSVHLALPSSPALLWEETFRAKLRSQIRRPQKEGMEARFGAGEIDAFYHVFSRNMRDLGTPVHSRRLFLAIAGAFPERALFGVVYHRGAPVAGGCGFFWGDEFELTWASSLREANRLSPNMLLYWEFMTEAIHRGSRTFSFGRCSPGAGTHRFKQQWGGTEVPLPWGEWTPGEPRGASSEEGRLRRLATRAWRKLPVPLANRVGPSLSRSIPWF